MLKLGFSHLGSSLDKIWQVLILGLDVDVQVRLEALADEAAEGCQVRFQVDVVDVFRTFRRFLAFKERVVLVFDGRLVERIRRFNDLGLLNRFFVLKKKKGLVYLCLIRLFDEP